MDQIKWGICSAGKISNQFLTGIKTLPQSSHKIVAVGARSLESATKLANLHSVPKAYGSYDELAADPDIDIVYIGTIHPTHLSAASKMLEAGKPVLCEKPLSMNATETKAMIELAKKKNLFLMEAMWTRFFPATVRLRQLLSEKAIGDVNLVTVDFGFRKPADRDARFDEPELGASCLLDMGVYAIAFVSMVYGSVKPEKIYSQAILSEKGVDKLVTITLVYPGNRIAQLLCSIITQMSLEAHIYGTKGKIRVPSKFNCPTSLETPAGMEYFPLPKPYMENNFKNCEGFSYEAEEVRQCLLKGKKESDIMPLGETLIVAEIMDEVMRQINCVHSKK